MDDMMIIFQLYDALKRVQPKTLMNMAIHYFPYGRQDRVCHPGESFALEVFIKMLASLDWCMIGIVDPHSEETERLLKQYDIPHLVGIQVSTLTKIQMKYGEIYDCFIAPDDGAAKKMKKQGMDQENHIFTMKKTRTLSGLSHTELDKDVLSGKLLVVDDICDGGATFLSVAKRIHESQPRVTQLDLYVTHGIFSKGVDELLQHYDNIYCFNMMSQDPNVIENVKS
jgi:ribose-phosphate pyrophosphokinase